MKSLFTKPSALKQKPELDSMEKELIGYMSKGLNSKEIALSINCSKEKLNIYRKSILEKTNCSSMFDVFSLAERKGWL